MFSLERRRDSGSAATTTTTTTSSSSSSSRGRGHDGVMRGRSLACNQFSDGFIDVELQRRRMPPLPTVV